MNQRRVHGVRDFLAAMPGYSAVFKPNFILANTVVDEATRLGGIPVLDPDDIRMASFTNGSDHIINFNHNWQRQLDHIFTYMLQTGRCAKSGIIYGANNSNYIPYVNSMTKLFTDGGYGAPPSGDFTKMTDAQVRAFFQEPNRNCFVLLGSNYFSKYVLYRLNTLGISPTSLNFYGVSSLTTDSWSLNGVSSYYATVNYLHWSPLFTSSVLSKAFAEWLPNTADYSSLFAAGNGETLPTAIVPTTLQGYIVMMFMMETIRGAVSREASPNATGFLPLTWSSIVDSFYEESRNVEGFQFVPLVRSCPRAPATQICYCNVLTRASYIFGVNTTTTLAYPIYDDTSKGQREVASLTFPNSCGYYASAWSYPITGLALYPAAMMGSGQRTADEDAYDVYQAVYGRTTYDVNYAATAPTRALRYAAYDVKSNETLSVVLDKYIDSLRPFVIYGSMAGPITNPKGILTLSTSMLTSTLEEPELVPHSQWRWDVLKLQPVIADYIHSLIAFSKSRTFTSINAIASTQREAELISMSYATWGINFPVSTIIISDDPNVWAAYAVTILNNTDSRTPFLIACTNDNPNSLVQAIMMATGPIGKGTLAMATALINIYYAKPFIKFNLNNNGDIIFGSFRKEWWKSDAVAAVTPSLRNYSLSPRYHQAMIVLDAAKQLYSQVYYDYATSAAEVLYRLSVVTAVGNTLGPFSNTTCTDAEIASNTRDRTCQCTKGVRRFFVLSMRNYISGSSSSRTGSYAWTMTTCGMVYTEYVDPTLIPSSAIVQLASAALSNGAIAGIAVGASLALILLIIAFVVNTLFFGRNNRAAPKDASQPFAIVFTDIQSSTALWARAPAAMSEAVDQHHELMRKALRRNGGYEVKTVGDCFMIAFKDPVDATTFSLDIQVMLHAADWSEELDATYLELIAEAEVAAATSMIDDASTQSEGMNPNRRQSAKLTDNLSHQSMISTDSHNMAFHQRNQNGVLSFGTPTPRLGESPRAGESPRHHQPSMVITHTRTPNQSVHLSMAKPVRSNSQVQPSQLNESSMLQSEEELFGAAGPWHGLRVRIGVHYGMGDIRKDPVSLGFDYYGTVVNTAARVEGVGHGGQTLLTDAAFDALPPGFAKSAKAVIVALGPQPLRGLDAPIKLFQMVPASLQGRHFPALRLHVEKDTEESSVTETTTATGTNASETPEVLASRICASRQFMGISPEELLDRYHYFMATFGPAPDKYKASVITKLAESWGFEKASKAVHAGEFGRTRLLVSMIAKVTKTYHAGQKALVKRHRNATRTLSNNPETMSEAVKSIHMADVGSFSDGRYYN
eukprot:GILI01002338.1.p1 GENE.GILI01002338.1~~GILI01002338.1.p1  ORF type:complete len:1308 (+),score=317.28 GILI01002338.1:34-3957(+)